MRPTRRGVILIVAGALLAPPAAGVGPFPAATQPAGADTCVNVEQFVRVAHRKRLKRHGKTRVKKWITIERRTRCEPLAADEAVPGSTPRRLQVTATEFQYVLSRPNVGTGNVTIELDNEGEDPHNMNLQLGGAGPVYTIDDVDPDNRTTRTFPLTPGSWRMWCSLLNHDALGMNATLVVDP